jgi:uncharacterized membrane protein YadS
VLAGVTVYAVPQVLAATMPVSLAALQIGTFVKLVRVLMLGPLLFLVSLGKSRRQYLTRGCASNSPMAIEVQWSRVVPWFILGFAALFLLRSSGKIPEGCIGAINEASTQLTIVSMAALGLGVDARNVAKSGTRVDRCCHGLSFFNRSSRNCNDPQPANSLMAYLNVEPCGEDVSILLPAKLKRSSC